MSWIEWVRSDEKLEAKERKILRKIVGQVKENGKYRRRYTNELYLPVERITDILQITFMNT